LLGPKLSFGGIYSSPIYYYLFTPILFLFRFDFSSVIYANALLFALGLSLCFYWFSQKFGFFKASFFCFTLGLTPLYLFLARHPGNAFTIMFFLQLLLLLLVLKPKLNLTTLMASGFLSGVIVSLHPVTLLIVLALLPVIYTHTSKKLNLLFFVMAGLIPFFPLIVFELKHNFIMLTNTFVHQSYKMFVNNENLGGPSQVSANPFINLFILSEKIGNYLAVNPLWLLTISAFLALKQKSSRFLVLVSLISLVLISVFLRHQFARHYLYPFAFLILFSFLYTLIRSKYYYLLLVYLAILIINFPKHYYQPTNRQLGRFENVVNQLIQSKFITSTEGLNVIQVRKNVATTPYGFEYRYYLLKQEIATLSEFQYPESRNLLVFSETNTKPKEINNWEIREFGKTNWQRIKKTKVDNLQIYLVSK
jgi:hypothetical protein